MTIGPQTHTLRVSEIYATILGESTFAGWPGVIVRLSGCPLRCVWCDSRFAHEAGEPPISASRSCCSPAVSRSPRSARAFS
jgi:organic radical activating enzyme